MPHYKDPNNNIHFLDSDEFENLLPDDSVKISDEEAEALQPPPENPRIAEIKAELLLIDQKRIRPIAEGDTDYLATLNAQAVALRAELWGLV